MKTFANRGSFVAPASWRPLPATLLFPSCGIVIGLVCSLSGCSRGLTVEFVEGTVTVDGKAASAAWVQFFPRATTEKANQLSAGGHTRADGGYRLTARLRGKPQAGTPAGEYDVTIHAYKDPLDGMPERPTDPAKAEAWDRESARRGSLPPEWLAPKEYADVETSGLSATVKPGKNRIDFDLKSEFKAGTVK
jgi:hypothetical protein